MFNVDIYAFIVSVDDLQCKIICSKSICNDILYPAASSLPMPALVVRSGRAFR